MMPRTIYGEDHEMLRESVRAFLAQEAAPYHAQWEKEGHVSRELWTQAGEMGFLCPTVPEEYGGPGLDFLFNLVVTEEISHAGLSGVGWGLHSDIAVPYIVNYGSEEQKQRYLPGCVSGEFITAIAMSEPAAGSDLQGVKTSAVRDGDGWVLNGSKTFITNGQLANLIIVVAKTDPAQGARGTSLFLVETDTTPGFERGRNLEKIGMKAQDTSELFFNNARLPAGALLGGEGQGFAYLMDELPQERLSVAANAVANAAAALEWTIEYVTDRKAFGQPIAGYQNTRFKLAEVATEIAVTRAFVDRCAELHIQGALDTATASMAKLKATELQCQVLDECLQLHGGYGYMWEYPIARAWADARVQRIYAGTSEVMKLIIARSLLGGQR